MTSTQTLTLTRPARDPSRPLYRPLDRPLYPPLDRPLYPPLYRPLDRQIEGAIAPTDIDESDLGDIIDEFLGTAVPVRDGVLSVTLDMFVQFLYTKMNVLVRIDPNETWKAYTGVRDCMALGAVKLREEGPAVGGGGPGGGGQGGGAHTELAEFLEKVADWHGTSGEAETLSRKLRGVTHAMTRFVQSKSTPPAVVSQASHMKLVLRLIVGSLAGLSKPMSKISSALSGAVGACFGRSARGRYTVDRGPATLPAETIANELNTAEAGTAAALLLSSVPTHKNKFYLAYAACFLHFVLGIQDIANEPEKKEALADIHFMHPAMNRKGDGEHNAECERARRTAAAAIAAYEERTLSTAEEDGDVFFKRVFPPLPPLWFEIIPCMRLRALWCAYRHHSVMFSPFVSETPNSYSMQTLYEQTVDSIKSYPKLPDERAWELHEDLFDKYHPLERISINRHDGDSVVVFSCYHGAVRSRADLLVVPSNVTLVTQGMIGFTSANERHLSRPLFNCQNGKSIEKFATHLRKLGCDIVPSGYSYPDVQLGYTTVQVDRSGERLDTFGVFYCPYVYIRKMLTDVPKTSLSEVLDLVSKHFKGTRVFMMSLHCHVSEDVEHIRIGHCANDIAAARLPCDMSVLHTGGRQIVTPRTIIKETMKARINTANARNQFPQSNGEVVGDPSLWHDTRKIPQRLWYDASTRMGTRLQRLQIKQKGGQTGGSGASRLASISLFVVTVLAAFAHPLIRA